ncbi:hypothetical protein, partial [Pseudoalteromonas piscicida]|uniref:hypothetical protein n=1 Tax=Pseudoalteromonas piscicida TaxID=43662 RepID=UPI001BB251BB
MHALFYGKVTLKGCNPLNPSPRKAPPTLKAYQYFAFAIEDSLRIYLATWVSPLHPSPHKSAPTLTVYQY